MNWKIGTLALLLGLGIGWAKSGHAVQIQEISCNSQSRDGLSVLQMDFKPAVPVLSDDLVVKDDSGNIVQQTTSTPITAQAICGVAVDFKKDCQVAETMPNGIYRYLFECASAGISGRLGLEGGVATLTCKPKGQAETARQYQGCHIEAR